MLGCALPSRRGGCAAHEVAGADVDEPGHLAVHQPDVDHLPLPRAVAVAQRREDAHGRLEPADHVGHAHADLHRHALGLARQRHDPAVALGHQVVAGLEGVGPGAPIARDRAPHEVRVRGRERLGVEAVAREAPGLEVLHHHVGARGEATDDGLPPRRGDVHRDRALVAVGAQEVGAQIRGALDEGRPPLAGVVAPRRRVLDLEHVGAQIAQHLRAGRPREDAREVEHDEPGERAAVRGARPVALGGAALQGGPRRAGRGRRASLGRPRPAADRARPAASRSRPALRRRGLAPRRSRRLASGRPRPAGGRPRLRCVRHRRPSRSRRRSR